MASKAKHQPLGDKSPFQQSQLKILSFYPRRIPLGNFSLPSPRGRRKEDFESTHLFSLKTNKEKGISMKDKKFFSLVELRMQRSLTQQKSQVWENIIFGKSQRELRACHRHASLNAPAGPGPFCQHLPKL